MSPVRAPSPAARPAAPAEAAADAELRSLTAVLRWRARWLLRRLTPELAIAARFVPVLLHASFANPLLRKEAPGVGTLRYRRAWAGWARQCGQAPPLSMQRQRGLIDAVVAVQRGEGLELLCFAAPGLRAHDRPRVTERIAAIRSVLGPAARLVTLRLVEEGPLSDLEREECLVFGALIAGLLPPALAEKQPVADPAALAAELAARTSSEVATAALLLLSGASGPSAAASLRAALRNGRSARALADPAEACVRWAGPASGQEALLEKVLRWSRSAGGAKPPPPVAEVLEVGRALALACAAAVRRVPRPVGTALRERVRRQLIGPGLPRMLLPLLAAAPLQFEPISLEKGQGYKVRLPDGTLVGSGRTLMQARVRALALRAAARRPVSSGNPLNDLIEARLARGVERPTLLLVIEHQPAPGPPFDPINRGPDRVIALASATGVRMRPGGRPSGWRLRPAEAVRRVFQDSLAGFDVEVVALTPEGHPTAARLLRVASFVRKQRAPAPAIEAGGEVLLARDGRVRRLGLRRFALRPLACSADPEAFDLDLSPERGTRPQAVVARRGQVECRAYRISDTRGCLLTRDDGGFLLREEIRLDRIEEHLREAPGLLRGGAPPAMLAARLSGELESDLRLHKRTLERLALSIGGELPFRLWVEVGGDRISLAPAGGWAAAAQLLMAGVPDGAEVRLGVDRTAVTVGGATASPLLQLYARSLVLRRLGAQLRRELSRIPGGASFEP